MILPPEPEEIEVSVFGRGYGESILIHATQNNWFIVDSCINPSTERPASLEYLDKIGIDPALAVKQIIADLPPGANSSVRGDVLGFKGIFSQVAVFS